MLTFNIYLLINSYNRLTIEAIESFSKAKINPNIKKYISTSKYFSKKILKDFDLKTIEIINHKTSFTHLWEHMRWLTFNTNSDFISFVHEDDLFNENFFLKTYYYLEKYNPLAFSNRVLNIDYNSYPYKRRQRKPIDKILFVTRLAILNRYFLPFDTGITLPTIAFKRIILSNYWSQYNLPNLTFFEDVRIIYFFVHKGLFIENQDSKLYLYRKHENQGGNTKIPSSRLRLISWLRSQNIPKINKFILLFFAKLQYMFFYKKPNFKSSIINNFLNKARVKLIRFRNGENLFSK